ncbi:hypothetical protein G6F56_005739 [Rhizopus delemar]|nr:hypothetical protein G6F56_005739 [Rhizopus delemar]
MEAVALVKRGACSWSEKVSVINDLSSSEKMNVTAALIYDNQTYSGISIKTALYQATVSFPEYSTPLPSDRSVLNMTDNDLSQSSIGVYFVPYVYGNTLKSKLNKTYNSSDPTIRTFWSITTYFPQDDSSNGFVGSIRGYFAYIIALAAIFVIGVIFLRWWKLRCMRNNRLNSFNNNNIIHLQQRVNQIDPLPVDIVNSLAVKSYEMGSIKNTNCAICLDDFSPGKSDIRMLPCGHGFCVLCIDPWLTQKSTLCPICKWDCLPSDTRRERSTDNETSYTVDMELSVTNISTDTRENTDEYDNPNRDHTESEDELVASVTQISNEQSQNSMPNSNQEEEDISDQFNSNSVRNGSNSKEYFK